MRVRSAYKPKGLSFDMTPLIDVTFLLIVFFVMSNRLIQDEVAMEAELPRETTGKAIDENDDSLKLIVNVDADGNYFLGAKKVELDELKTRLERAKKRSDARGRKTSVRIRADRSVPYGTIEPALVICAQVGFEDASFAVVQK